MVDTSRPPALQSTADTEPYVPLSWVAVAAFGMAIALILTLFAMAVDAYAKKRPLLQPEVIVVFVAAVVLLSFIARRVVRNSEGTRSGRAIGLDLPVTAWWIAVATGLSYLAYWLAVALPVYWDARAEVNKWVTTIGRGDLAVAFHQTIPPGGRQEIAAADLATMEARYRTQWLQFRQSNLVRTALRNKDACAFEPAGLRDWSFEGSGLNCVINGVLVCPEGHFMLLVPLRATEQLTGDRQKVSTGRQWQILPHAGGYITTAERTPYGWTIDAILRQGEELAQRFLNLQSFNPSARRESFVTFVEDADPLADRDAAPLAAVGGWSLLANLPPAWLDRTTDRLFTLENGAAPSESERQRFRLMWRTLGLLPPGARVKDSLDQGSSLSISESGLELRIPVEVPMPGLGGEPTAAQGRLVLACTDPAVLAQLKDLRANAKSDPLSEKPPENLALPPNAWRVLRVESNLKPVPVATTPPPSEMGS